MAIAATAAAATLMVMRSIGGGAVDFSYVLTAGRMWIAGADPYGPGFLAAGAGVVPAGATGFAYPPNWWIIAAALASIPGSGGVFAWKLLNIGMLVTAGLLLVRSAKRLQPLMPEWLPYLFLVSLFACGATSTALRLGQTSIVALLGFALLVDGMTSDRRFPQTAGLTLLLLKPQIGLLLFLLALTRSRTRGSAIAACAATVLACIPTLLTLGVAGTVASAHNFLRNLGAYDDLPWNWPRYMSGLPFVGAGIGVQVSPLLAILASWLAAEIALRRHSASKGPSFAIDFWFVSIAALVAIVPLHLYDFVLCIPWLLLLPSCRNGSSLGFLLLALVLVGAANEVARIYFLLTGASDDGYWAATGLQAGLLTLGGISALATALCHLNGRHSNTAVWNGAPPNVRPA